ncbi:hypothetical protein [Vibrio salinus]|uniref:hypothetical protein n=1 Tax=Vibrio salinus TaxID=2899784 RepID=UPI001E4AD2C3|nr:hypothetical protein [Vibrio salinus]MCE0493453.1 hypothetical protein [Vibrio salinus]MCE0493454.1 hypothetical protein [Vibrio salinus]MCE0493685.1 hypothetical protein [Vibrio salinus]
MWSCHQDLSAIFIHAADYDIAGLNFQEHLIVLVFLIQESIENFYKQFCLKTKLLCQLSKLLKSNATFYQKKGTF